MKSLFVISLLETDNIDYLYYRLRAFEELVFNKDIAQFFLSCFDEKTANNTNHEMDGFLKALAHEVHQENYLKTEYDLLVKKCSAFGPYSEYEGKGLCLQNFKIISAAAVYTVSKYLLNRYQILIDKSEAPIGEDADELIVLFTQLRRFYSNLLSAITKKEYKEVFEELEKRTNKRKNSGRATDEKNKRRLEQADADIERLAKAWWSVSKKISAGHLATSIDRYVSQNKAYGLKPYKNQQIPMVSKAHVIKVVKQVEKDLGLKTSKTKPPVSLTIKYFEQHKQAPKEWLEYKKQVKDS